MISIPIAFAKWVFPNPTPPNIKNGLNEVPPSLCDQGKSFSNKIWNSFRLVKGWKVVKKNQPTHCSIAIEWYNQKFNSVLSEINDHFNKFRISDALMAVSKSIHPL